MYIEWARLKLSPEEAFVVILLHNELDEGKCVLSIYLMTNAE